MNCCRVSGPGRTNESLALEGSELSNLGNQVPQGARTRLRITSFLEVTRELRLNFFFWAKYMHAPSEFSKNLLTCSAASSCSTAFFRAFYLRGCESLPLGTEGQTSIKYLHPVWCRCSGSVFTSPAQVAHFSSFCGSLESALLCQSLPGAGATATQLWFISY